MVLNTIVVLLGRDELVVRGILDELVVADTETVVVTTDTEIDPD